MEAYARRTGRESRRYFAIGSAETILERIAQYMDAGLSKFILRPVGVDGEDVLAQTRKLIETVLPLVAARWPRGAKPAA
jgi:hypothetical protein